MRHLLLLALLSPALAAASDPAPATPESASSTSATFPRFGVSAAAGVPDGAVLSGVFRPLDWMRLSAGGSWNYFGYGLQGGVGVAPFHWRIDPTFNLEVGHYFDADMSWVADRSAGVPTEMRPLLEKVGYNYANAQLGIELGSSRRFVFFLRAGISYLWTTVRGASQATNTYATSSGTQTATVQIADPRFRATLPSLKLGVLFYL
ncbi:MAG: hypothetical protein WCC48_11990 [Anaeromyxobacteraceae bacterium]